MKTSSRVRFDRLIIVIVAIFGLSTSSLLMQMKANAACSALPSDKGTVTATVNIQSAGSYRVWSRIKTDTASNNSFYMQIDQTYCSIVVGGSTLPVNTWTWVDYYGGNSTTKVVANLSSGNHTFTMAGKDNNVMLDRVILTQDGSCVPVGAGDNCVNPAPDTTPPTISSVSVGSVTQTTSTVSWMTNEAADSKVDYGPTASYGSTASSATMSTSHSIGLSGLTANTTYHYRVTSKDAANNSSSSSDATFTTQAVAGDTTKPTVSVTAPSSGASVSGNITITATASDNVGVAGVQFKLDGGNLGSELTAAPYIFNWNSKSTSNGSHTITAVARDAAGNTQTATTVTITVNNTAFLPADIDEDGVVGPKDFSILSRNYGKSGSNINPTRADIDGDGVVGPKDFSILSRYYGTGM